MQRRDRVVLQKMISEMQIGIDMLGDMSLSDFLCDEMLKRALGMTAINIGELVKAVTDELRSQYKEFPWKAAAGMRDVTAHRYQTLRMEDVYYTVKVEYPILKNKLEMILGGTDFEED